MQSLTARYSRAIRPSIISPVILPSNSYHSRLTCESSESNEKSIRGYRMAMEGILENARSGAPSSRMRFPRRTLPAPILSMSAASWMEAASGQRTNWSLAAAAAVPRVRRLRPPALGQPARQVVDRRLGVVRRNDALRRRQAACCRSARVAASG